MASIEGEGAEPLQLKTCVLKVSIHCEGCKKKVRRILKRCEGIQTIEIDSKQNKVTATGNIEAETLIRKLLKSGKHAELWPTEEKPKNPNPNSNSSEKEENKGREQNASYPSEHPNPSSNGSAKEKNKGKGLSASKPNEQISTLEKKPEKSSETTTKSETKSENDTKSTKTVTKEEAPVVTDVITAEKATKAIETDTESNTKISKNSNKEASNSDTKPENDTNSADTVAKSDDSGSKKDTKEAEDARSGVQLIHNQPLYHQPSVYLQPVYVAGYNVVHPTSSSSYYAPTPAMSQGYIYSDNPSLMSQAYNYLDNRPLEYYPNYVRENYYGSMGYEASSSSSQPQSGYDYFNDENPNSCSVM